MPSHLTVIATFGAWHPGVRPGHVLVYATPGGTHAAGAERRRFLVPSIEYAIGPRPFIIDPTKYEEIK